MSLSQLGDCVPGHLSELVAPCSSQQFLRSPSQAQVLCWVVTQLRRSPCPAPGAQSGGREVTGAGVWGPGGGGRARRRFWNAGCRRRGLGALAISAKRCQRHSRQSGD